MILGTAPLTAAVLATCDYTASITRAGTATDVVDATQVAVTSLWDPTDDGAECVCGMILAPLPGPVTVTRVYALNHRTYERVHTYRYGHAVTADGHMLCHACWNDPHGHLTCTEHDAVTAPCDEPHPITCEGARRDDERCENNRPVDSDLCGSCTAYAYGDADC